MPLSDKQLKANRQNARNSTGPKSDEGKTIASRNSTKHGLYSDEIIISSPRLQENREDYENLVAALFNEFRPVGEFQEQLVLKIANCLWRSRRVINAETARVNQQLNETKTLNESELLNTLKLKTIPTDYFARLFLRYEMRLDRQLARTYKMLIHNQKLNQGYLIPKETEKRG